MIICTTRRDMYDIIQSNLKQVVSASNMPHLHARGDSKWSGNYYNFEYAIYVTICEHGIFMNSNSAYLFNAAILINSFKIASSCSCKVAKGLNRHKKVTVR